MSEYAVGPTFSRGNGELLDIDASFEHVLEVGLDELRKGFTLWHIDDRGTARMIAYYVGQRREGGARASSSRMSLVLHIVEPALVPPAWQPGAHAKYVGDRSVIAELAPESADASIEMSRTSVRGIPYPSAIEKHVYGFTDTSWKNDVTDSISFAIAGKPYTIWLNHPSYLHRDPEGPDTRFAMYELENEEDDLDAAIREHELDWHADSVIETDDPNELVNHILEMAKHADPRALRDQILDKLDDPTQDPRLARRNPSEETEDERLAREKFEEFNRFAPTKIFQSKTQIPARVRKLGDALFVLYESKKNDPDTGLPVKDAIRYIHEHDSAGVEAFVPDARGDVEVPSFIREATAVVRLGKCLGYAWKDDDGDEREKKPRPTPDLYTTPCGRALLVIKDNREILAMVWGGALGVEARGIVG